MLREGKRLRMEKRARWSAGSRAELRLPAAHSGSGSCAFFEVVAAMPGCKGTAVEFCPRDNPQISPNVSAHRLLR